jgi:hypothetical protein
MRAPYSPAAPAFSSAPARPASLRQAHGFAPHQSCAHRRCRHQARRERRALGGEAILARTWLAQRGRIIKGLDLPVGLGVDGICAAFDKLMQAVNDGVLSAAEAQDYVALLKAQHEMLETADINKRLAALERGEPAHEQG